MTPAHSTGKAALLVAGLLAGLRAIAGLGMTEADVWHPLAAD